MSIVIADGVFIVIEDAASERRSGVVVGFEVAELAIEALFEQLEDVLLFVFDAHLPYGFFDSYGQSGLFHLV